MHNSLPGFLSTGPDDVPHPLDDGNTNHGTSKQLLEKCVRSASCCSSAQHLLTTPFKTALRVPLDANPLVQGPGPVIFASCPQYTPGTYVFMHT